MRNKVKGIEVVNDLYLIKEDYFTNNFIKTQMFVDGVLVNAKIDSDGVITPLRNKATKRKPIPINNKEIIPVIKGDLLGYTPHWVNNPSDLVIAQEQREIKECRLVKENRNNYLLKDYLKIEQATEDYWFLDSILFGASHLDVGANSRPLSQSLLFNMLRDLDSITTESIRSYTNYSERYCQKLATVMRVLVNDFDKRIKP